MLDVEQMVRGKDVSDFDELHRFDQTAGPEKRQGVWEADGQVVSTS